MAKKIVTVKVARTDGNRFESRLAQIETEILTFDGEDTATLSLAGQKQPYRLTWIVTGEPGEYKVQITTPPEAIDPAANARKRRIDLDGFGAGQRKFTVDA